MAKAYLKWIGGKSQLINEIVPRLPNAIETWIEPFCGSCSIFFDIFDNDCLIHSKPKKAILNDINRLLINCHFVVGNYLEKLSPVLTSKELSHLKSPSGFYYSERVKVKDIKINTLDEKIEAAALFLYINKACFNGLWRVNAAGGLNAAWNKKNSVKLNSDKVNSCSKLLREFATLSSTHYEDIIAQNTGKEDFFFLDPPYVPVSKTASFVSYAVGGWKHDDTVKLRDYCDLITQRGQKFMFTNSNSPVVFDLFGKYNIVEVKANRLVSVLADRPKVQETIITNYDCQAERNDYCPSIVNRRRPESSCSGNGSSD